MEHSPPSSRVEFQMDAQRLGDANDREVTAMSVSREQMLEELRKAQQARDLLTELRRRLAGGNSELEDLLTHLEQLAQTLSEADPIRLLIESAVG
jgi:L-lactate utilization protein LutB